MQFRMPRDQKARMANASTCYYLVMTAKGRWSMTIACLRLPMEYAVSDAAWLASMYGTMQAYAAICYWLQKMLFQGYLCFVSTTDILPMTIFLIKVADGVCNVAAWPASTYGKCKHLLLFGNDCKGMLVQGYLCEHYRHSPNGTFRVYSCRWSM